MQRFDPMIGVAAAALSIATMSACSAPPAVLVETASSRAGPRCCCRAARPAAETRGNPAAGALAAGPLDRRAMEVERRTLRLGTGQICRAPVADRQLDRRLLGGAAAGLDVDRRPMDLLGAVPGKAGSESGLFCVLSAKAARGTRLRGATLEERMYSLGRIVGVAGLVAGVAALSGCYPPPPTYPVAAGPPASFGFPPASPPGAFPPQPPAAYVPGGAASPPYPLAAEPSPQYGTATPPGIAPPSGAGSSAMAVSPVAPPPARVETPPSPPSPAMIWQSGHWSWSGGQYVWVSGHYMQRPTPTANWLPGYWHQGPNGWMWVEGRWA